MKMIFEKKATDNFNDFIKLNEDKKSNSDKHLYGCAMLFFKFDKLKEIQDKIEDYDLYTEEDGYGLEKEPHLTLLYGLHTDEVTSDEVINTITEYNMPNLTLFNISSFKNDKFDVLKFEVKSKMDDYSKKDDVIYLINKDLCKLPYTSDFPKYQPHSTIAYLKPGTSDKYIKMFKNEEYDVTPIKIVYSENTKSGDKKKTNKKLN